MKWPGWLERALYPVAIAVGVASVLKDAVKDNLIPKLKGQRPA